MGTYVPIPGNSTGSLVWDSSSSTWTTMKSGVTTPTSTVTGFANSLTWGLYSLTPTTRTDGQSGPLQTNALGGLLIDMMTAIAGEDISNNVLGITTVPLAVSTYCYSTSVSTSLVASVIVKASAGVLQGLTTRIDSSLASGTYYLQAANTTTAVTATYLFAPIKVVHTSGVDDFVDLDFSKFNGIYASVGIVLQLSSTEFTTTLVTAALSSTVGYK